MGAGTSPPSFPNTAPPDSATAILTHISGSLSVTDSLAGITIIISIVVVILIIRAVSTAAAAAATAAQSANTAAPPVSLSVYAALADRQLGTDEIHMLGCRALQGSDDDARNHRRFKVADRRLFSAQVYTAHSFPAPYDGAVHVADSSTQSSTGVQTASNRTGTGFTGPQWQHLITCNVTQDTTPQFSAQLFPEPPDIIIAYDERAVFLCFSGFRSSASEDGPALVFRTCTASGRLGAPSATCVDTDECASVAQARRALSSLQQCINTNGSYACACTAPDSMLSSDNRTSTPNPCGPGTCTDLVADFTCSCEGTGFQGDLTLTTLLPPDSTPAYMTSFTRTCRADQTYTNTELACRDVNECDPDAQDQPRTYQQQALYTCDDGYTTTGDAQAAATYTATCTATGNYTFQGTCVEVDECAAQPCMNGGMCTDLVNAFECACVGEWGGPTCSDDTNRPPERISLSTTRVPENTFPLPLVTVTVEDPDTHQSHTLQVLSSTPPGVIVVATTNGGSSSGGAGAASPTLEITRALDFEVDGSAIEAVVRATDNGTISQLSADFLVRINVEDNNDAPTAVLLDTTSIAENTPCIPHQHRGPRCW
ncbi:hypothetical protein PTSG_06479 [Salpingoeca rosetta]|uniref:EGF-like domain-containing protein n=1 Tax=Salpingoeca rosetta (strain ATCC 50818 / BSB-021) TaxID=946362 RepID=F2UFX6_SALR5|nr:uncharacterized protein PTSG_06479 [Salpingoeca rosetta]EGD75404.1 hypothetical protein PTSG_06479 [Salpingoeca rosetta]|eukprot:XP_004991861.1 hypothetical protein PTSG_06479 [Salpingoeca rosetta]